MRHIPPHRHSEAGFSLVEFGIVIMIAGLIMGGAMVMMKPFVETARRNATTQKEQNIARVLSAYVQQHHRLPCPADPNPAVEPFGSPRQSSATGDLEDRGCTAPGDGTAYAVADHIGIIPFRILGLTEENVTDSWGNLMTYSVSPVLAGYNPTTASSGKIHNRCRISNVWYDTSAAANKNVLKARVCCARAFGTTAATADVDVLAARATTQRLLLPQRSVSNSGPYNTETTGVATSTDYNNRFVAYILISHGQNGDGAFVRLSAAVKPTTIAGTPQESENRNPGDNVFVDREYSISTSTGNTYFDDIVLWRANDQLYSEFGNDNCARP